MPIAHANPPPLPTRSLAFTSNIYLKCHTLYSTYILLQCVSCNSWNGFREYEYLGF